METNYGGKVTDDKDRRFLTTLFKEYFNEDILKKDFSLPKPYGIPNAQSKNEFISYIKTLPDNDQPEILGLNRNS